jgi:hypothetical protein
MSRFILSFLGGFSGAVIKWALIAFLWIGSIIFVTTSALALDAISDAMMKFTGIPTLHLDQKRRVAKAKTDLQVQKQQTARARKQLTQDRAIRKRALITHGKQVDGFVVKMVKRNVAAAGTALLPAVGGIASVGFAVADVHAGCELIAMQNELETIFGMANELSGTKEACVRGIAAIDELGLKAEAELAEMQQVGQRMSETVAETVGEWNEQMPTASEMSSYLTEQMCRVSGNC